MGCFVGLLVCEVFCLVIIFYESYRKADHLLEIVSEDKSDLRKHKIAYGWIVILSCSYSLFLSLVVGGLGFGLIAAIVMFANVLAVSSGPGTVRANQYFVAISGTAHVNYLFNGMALFVSNLHYCTHFQWIKK